MTPFVPTTTNKVKVLTTVDEILEHWSFFYEAMVALNDPSKARANYTPEEFFNMLVKCTQLGREGLVLVLTSKNGKPLGCGCAFTGTDFCGETCFFVWAAYTTGRCTTALQELMSYAEDYARHIGHKNFRMSTPRINGAAFRLFEDKLGFRRDYITFKKSL
jgi:hypothetical protein